MLLRNKVAFLRGNDALNAQTGARVRIYFLDADPNFISSFHIIGELMDEVYSGGGLSNPGSRSPNTRGLHRGRRNGVPMYFQSCTIVAMEMPSNTLLMNKLNDISIGPASFTDAPFSSANDAVTAFATANNLQRLEKTVESRLNRLASGQPGKRLRALRDPAEFINQAFELILTGRRKTRQRNLRSFCAFRNYLQGVIQSLITHELERIVRQGEDISLDSMDGRELESSTDVVREVALVETKESLFGALRAYAKNNPSILEAIGQWEQNWPFTDRIPKCDLSDKQIHSIRSKSRELLRRSAARDGIIHPTGREFFQP